MARPKSVHVQHEGSNDRDKLAVTLQKALNDSQKDGKKIAYFLDEKDDPSTIVDHVSTGSTLLDLAISNMPNGGLPVGRICEINGLESTAKSLLCAHIIAETQKRGGFAALLDPEFAAAPDFWTSLGVSIKDLLYLPYENLEGILYGLERIIGESRKDYPDRLITLIVDSIASVPTKKEQEMEYSDIGYNTDKSKLLSLALRRITGLMARQRILTVFTNQLRYNLAASRFGDKYIEPGGLAFRYHASVRIRMTRIGNITDKDKNLIGVKIQALVKKNRCGPQGRNATFDVLFDSGIQDLSSWLEYMKTYGIITGTKAGYTYKSKSFGDMKFNADKFVELINTDSAFKEEIYKTICDKYIMIYRNPASKIVEDAEYVDGSDEETENVDNEEEKKNPNDLETVE